VQAVQAYQSGNRDRAVDRLIAATRANPDLIMARLMLGDLYRESGDYPAAMNQYEALIKRDPYSWSNHNKLGETYQFLDKVRSHYGIPVEAFFPQPEAVQDLVRKKGLFSFYQDGHKECCGIRKVEQLVRALTPLRAWVTGQRKDQSPNTRADIPVVQLDRTFSTAARPLVKFNPLSFWTSQQVWSYIRDNDVPYNALHDRGFISIGCEPCTRPTNPGQHERAGPWWWEEETKKECGLHVASTANTR
jgi:phosphoadenosine phosphosulfate reductase